MRAIQGKEGYGGNNMKKTFTGWIGKIAIKTNMRIIMANMKKGICPIRGPKDDWGEGEWPPTKVKVTVETVEK